LRLQTLAERDTGNAEFNDGTFRGTLAAGAVDIINGTRSCLIDPEGSFEVLDIAGNGLNTVARVLQQAPSGTSDALEIRKETSNGYGLFVDCRTNPSAGIFVDLDSSFATGDGISVKNDGSGDAIYVDHNNSAGRGIFIESTNQGLEVFASNRGVNAETSGTGSGNDAGVFLNTGTGGGEIYLRTTHCLIKLKVL